MTTQDIVKAIDLTGLPSVGAADINQMLDNATPSDGRGLILYSVDTALGVADTPDVTAVPRYARYLWLRIPHATATDRTPALYAYNPTSSSWNTVLDITGIDLDNLSADALTSGLIPTLRFGDNSVPLVALQRDDTEVLDGIQKAQVTGSNALLVNEVRTISGPVINCKAFGAVGDGTTHTLQEWVTAGYYANLAAIQVDYPFVSALTETLDYVGIQAALNCAWKKLAAIHQIQTAGVDLTNTIHCNVPPVYIPSGEYLITKSLIIPPHCSLNGEGNTVIKYTPSDTKWSYMYSTSSFVPLAGVNCAFVIFHDILNTTVNITDNALAKHITSIADVSVVAGDRVTAISAEISDIKIILNGTAVCGIYAPSVESYEIKNVHITQTGTDITVSNYIYGIIGSYQTMTGSWKLSKITGCYFESLTAGVYIDRAKSGFLFQNNKTRSCAYGLRAEAASKFSVEGNLFESDLTGKNATLYVKIAGLSGTIVGNIFANMAKAIEVSGASINISNNAFLVSSSVVAATGYCIDVYTRAVAGPVSMDTSDEVLTSNYGYVIGNNNINFLTSVPTAPTYVPIYINNTADSIFGTAYGNTYSGLSSETNNYIISQAKLPSFKVIDDQLIRREAFPTNYPSFGGQIFARRDFGPAGHPHAIVVRDEVYAGMDGLVEIGNLEVELNVTYTVTSATGTGYVTYNGVDYGPSKASTHFLGTSTAAFIPAGDAVVYKHVKNYWVPLSFQKKLPINDLTTITAASKTLSASEALAIPELEGVVIVVFSATDNDKVVELPAPSIALRGRELTLIIVRPTTANDRYLRIQTVGELQVIVPRIHYYPYVMTPGVGDVVPWTDAVSTLPNLAKYIYVSGNGTATNVNKASLRFCSKFLCDGTYWYQI